MNRRRPWLPLFALALGPAAVAAVHEVPLELVVRAEGSRTFIPAGMARLTPAPNPPPGEWKLPELKSAVPVFALARLGGRDRLLVLDQNDPADPFYGLLYADADGDGDLTDDPVWKGAANVQGGPYALVNFPGVRFRIDLGGTMREAVFTANAYFRSADAASSQEGRAPEKTLLPTRDQVGTNRFTFYLMTQGAMKGRFELGGKSYDLMLADRNANGRFDDRLDGGGSGGVSAQDLLYVSLPGEEVDFAAGLAFGDWLALDGRLFRLRVQEAEAKLLLEEAEAAAALGLPMAVERILVAAPQGTGHVLAFRPGKTIPVPAGGYRLKNYLARKPDDGGNLWRIAAMAPADAPLVTAGPEAVLPLGEPFLVGVAGRLIPGQAGLSTGLSLSLQLTGQGGERVTALDTPTRNAGSVAILATPRGPYRPTAPRFTIIGPDGVVVGQGDFKYG